ncbi:MAG TPA: hypothetical protein VFA10_10665 [Ktedonobacteraceae bacterium]|nr:hypothetical protein [Ktedonobacteraceae bacterium]
MSSESNYRRQQRLPTPTVVILIVVAVLLILGGFGFLIYLTSVQYTTSLRVAGTAAVQSTRSAKQTAQAYVQATANKLGTAQAAIYATATTYANEQLNQSATATATVDLVTATASALDDLYSKATSGTPALDDSLLDNTGPGQWDVGASNPHTGCTFMSDGYHVSEAQQGFFQPCLAHAMTFDNFAYQVSMTINKGFRGQGGLLFRTNSTNSLYYFFRISIDGSYALDIYTLNSQTGKPQAQTLTTGLTPAITTHLGTPNQLAVIARGSQLYLFANGTYIAKVADGTLSSGGIGLAVLGTNAPIDATFSNAQVWKM